MSNNRGCPNTYEWKRTSVLKVNGSNFKINLFKKQIKSIGFYLSSIPPSYTFLIKK